MKTWAVTRILYFISEGILIVEPKSFLYYACIYLGTALMIVPISRFLGLGAVLGYLIGGLIIGPHALGLIHHPQTILHLSELGVVILMFLIGLELRPQELLHNKGKIFGLGGLQLFGTTGIIAAMLPFLGDYSFLQSFVIALGLGLSSTAVGLQGLKDKKLMETEGGQASFFVLLFQDMAIIPVLAILPMLAARPDAAANSGSNHPLAFFLMTTLGVMAAIVFFGRFFLNRLLRRVARVGLRELFTMFSLFLVCGIAFIMDTFHLSMALGTFIAGLILSESEFRHQIESDLGPFKELLMGLFFMSIGMSIDFNVLAQFPMEVILSTVGLVVFKLVILYFLAVQFNIKGNSRGIFSIYLAQGGEFGFVLFGLALQVGLLDNAQSEFYMAIISFSMMLTPLLALLHERWGLRLIKKFARNSAKMKAVKEKKKKRKDVHRLTQMQKKSVIICGFGRMGQIVARMLHSHKIEATILDRDITNIETMQKFGFKVFYGDVTNLNLLEMAGAHQAHLVIIALDNPDDTIHCVELFKQHFPRPKIIARARDRVQAIKLHQLEVDNVVRETYGSSLEMSELTLEHLGLGPTQAKTLVNRFDVYDRDMMLHSASLLDKEEELITFVHQAKEELQRLIGQEYEEIKTEEDVINEDGPSATPGL